MKRVAPKTVFAAALVCFGMCGSAMAQQTGGGGGAQTTSGIMSGSGTSSFGSGITGNSGTSGSSGSSSSASGGAIFTPTTTYFGALSYGRTPFGTPDNLRGPNAANGIGGWNGSSATSSTRTGGASRAGTTTGLGGASGLNALGGLAGNRNRTPTQNTTQQSKVRVRLSASNMRTELGVPPVPATKFIARLDRLPNSEKYKSANIAVQGRTAIIDAPTLVAADIARLGQLLMLEPGIDNFQVAAQTPDQRAAPTSDAN